MQRNWNNHQEVKARKWYLLVIDHSETTQKYTANYVLTACFENIAVCTEVTILVIRLNYGYRLLQ